MMTIPVKYHIKIRPSEPHLQADQLGSDHGLHGSLRPTGQLRNDETELLTIAKHLSQAVIRMGTAQVSYDFYHQRNDALDYARKCQEELQAWMTRHVVKE
jgi:hypothetical protein